MTTLSRSLSCIRSPVASRSLSCIRPASASRSLLLPASLSNRPHPSSSLRKRHFQNILAPAEGSTDSPLAINKLTPRGWVLSDNLVIPGGTIIHSGKAVLWDVDPPNDNVGNGTGGFEAMWKGWEKERFSVFEVLVPRPEILLFGTGQRAIPAPRAIRDYISSLGIQLDVMDSRNAASTYNLLAEEGRTVAAALCPLQPVNPRTGGPR